MRSGIGAISDLKVFRQQLSLLWKSDRVWLIIAAATASMLYVELERIHRIGAPQYFRPRYPMLSVIGFMMFVAAGWALLVWRGEARARREYHWSLPVSSVKHDLLRVASGAVWLFVATLCCAIVGLTLEHLHGAPIYLTRNSHIHYHPGPIFWISFFTGPLLIYFLVSVLPLGTRRPGEWLLGLVAAWLALTIAGTTFDIPMISSAEAWPLSERFGLLVSVAGGAWSDFNHQLAAHNPVRVSVPGYVNVQNWIIGLLMWLTVAGAGILLAVRRRS